MVAVVKTGYSLHRVFNYNENKVKEGVANCIGAVNYPKDLNDLTLSNKLNRLIGLATLNEVVERNSVHISLNFHPSENFSHEKLQAIADSYMKQIGFGNQPYLVYEHMDAGHPHIHIITVKVDGNGQRIETQNIGKHASSTARRKVEKEFGLIKAEESKSNEFEALNPADVRAAAYGKGPTKTEIKKVLNNVLEQYTYSSLHELNALLKVYNVQAYRGKEDGIVYNNHGLYYRILDPKTAKPIGIPIKASDFFIFPTGKKNQDKSKEIPTLKTLEQKFFINKARTNQSAKNQTKNTIDLILNQKSKVTLDALIASMKTKGIDIVLRQKNPDAPIYGLTFIDHRTKSVFNGSELGKPYSANAIQKRCLSSEKQLETIIAERIKSSTNIPLKKSMPEPRATTLRVRKSPSFKSDQKEPINGFFHLDIAPKSILEELTQADYCPEYIPPHLRLKRKKRKKKRFNNP